MSQTNTLQNKRKIRLNYFLALICLLHAIFFMIYWVSVGDFRNSVDAFLGELVGVRLPWTNLLMVLTGLMGLWSLFRLIRFWLTLQKGPWKPGAIHWVYFGFLLLFLALFYGGFVMILQQNPSQRGVLFHLFNLTRLVGDATLFLIAGIWLRRLILHLRRKMHSADRRWPWAAGIVLVLIALVGLWLLPPLLPPNWAYEGNIPAKPALFAHRGASMLAPENTLGAAELAGDYQAFGFETDLRISQDGVPFLMHDETLARTTNISEVFPERIGDLASDFSMEELSQLNAGLWFIQKDPYDTISQGLVSQSQLAINQGQTIPTLPEALEVVDQKGMAILFDMRYPPEGHPYYDMFFEIVLDQCRESGLNEDIWFLVDADQLPVVYEEAPQFTRVIGVSSTNLPDPQDLVEQRYEIINVDTGIKTCAVSKYRARGLGVNVYTVDQPWLFSQFWLSGVTSVTTNNIQTLSQMDHPLVNIPYSRYLLFWGLFGIIVGIWLASSQPERDHVSDAPRQMVTPDLLDFAPEPDPDQADQDQVETEVLPQAETISEQVFPHPLSAAEQLTDDGSAESDLQTADSQAVDSPEQESHEGSGHIEDQTETTTEE